MISCWSLQFSRPCNIFLLNTSCFHLRCSYFWGRAVKPMRLYGYMVINVLWERYCGSFEFRQNAANRCDWWTKRLMLQASTSITVRLCVLERIKLPSRCLYSTELHHLFFSYELYSELQSKITPEASYQKKLPSVIRYCPSQQLTRMLQKQWTQSGSYSMNGGIRLRTTAISGGVKTQ